MGEPLLWAIHNFKEITMSKPIRLFKLVTGELVLGKFDEEANML